MPYGYYQLIRIISLFGFVYLAYRAYDNKQIPQAIIYLGLALLFQPVIKIALGRELWNVVDVIVAIGLIVSIFMEKKELN